MADFCFFVKRDCVARPFSVESTLRNMEESRTERIHLPLSTRHPSMRCMGLSQDKISVRGFIVRSWRPLRTEPSHPMLIMDFRAPRRMVLDQGPRGIL